MIICSKCNSSNNDGSNFCTNCGNPLSTTAHTPPAADPLPALTEDTREKTAGKKAIFAILSVALCLLLIAVFAKKSAVASTLLTPKVEVTAVTFSNAYGYTIEAGDSGTIPYTIEPADATDKTLVWTSSNENICSVAEDGHIYARREGSTTITATSSNGISTEVEVIVKAAWPDLKGVYNKYCSSSFAKLASDGSYLSIDTNPKDYDDYTNDDALAALIKVLKALDLPESLTEKMGSTRALDGIQSQTYDGLEVTWSYHPDHGLEVIFSVE